MDVSCFKFRKKEENDISKKQSYYFDGDAEFIFELFPDRYNKNDVVATALVIDVDEKEQCNVYLSPTIIYQCEYVEIEWSELYLKAEELDTLFTIAKESEFDETKRAQPRRSWSDIFLH